jgi:hypothetical protein
MQSTPTGLTFSNTAIETAQGHQTEAPFDAAYEQLVSIQPEAPLKASLVDGFRYHFLGDSDALERATQAFILNQTGIGLLDSSGFVDAAAQTFASAQAFQLIRDSVSEEEQTNWVVAYENLLDSIGKSETVMLLDRIWQMTATLVGGVVLQREDQLIAASDRFREIIAEEIHPEGYFPAVVERSEGGALQRQVMAAKGLVLAAEVASHVGVDLWNYEVRGISAKTAAIYAAAFFEYREQWQWDEAPDKDTHDAFYRANGAFLEFLNRQLRPEVLGTTLEQLRPLYDPYGGGFTTLTHAQPPRRGLFGRRRKR